LVSDLQNRNRREKPAKSIPIYKEECIPANWSSIGVNYSEMTRSISQKIIHRHPNFMRPLFIILSFIICLFSFPSFTKAELVDRIVAIVGEDAITLSELNEEGHSYFQAIMQKVPTQELEMEMQKARQEILNQLIERLLIQQQADKFGISISPEDIDLTIDSILMENNISVADFKRDLENRGLTEEFYRKKVQSQMLRSRLINFLIRSKIVISEDKINDYYNSYYATKLTTSGFHIAQMGFLWGEKFNSKTQAEALQKAEATRKLLLDGEDFSQLARDYSDLPSAEDGGDIGTFKKDELADYMHEAILTIKPGESTQIIETPIGYQILKLLAAQTSTATPPAISDVQEEIKTILFKQEMEKGYGNWISEIREQTFIKQNL
jgi:peptidyl-prolyl cis-trans isomerase SurA